MESVPSALADGIIPLNLGSLLIPSADADGTDIRYARPRRAGRRGRLRTDPVPTDPGTDIRYARLRRAGRRGGLRTDPVATAPGTDCLLRRLLMRKANAINP